MEDAIEAIQETIDDQTHALNSGEYLQALDRVIAFCEMMKAAKRAEITRAGRPRP